jgi:hypothetical protein
MYILYLLNKFYFVEEKISDATSLFDRKLASSNGPLEFNVSKVKNPC